MDDELTTGGRGNDELVKDLGEQRRVREEKPSQGSGGFQKREGQSRVKGEKRRFVGGILVRDLFALIRSNPAWAAHPILITRIAAVGLSLRFLCLQEAWKRFPLLPW